MEDVNFFTGSVKADGAVDVRQWSPYNNWFCFDGFMESLTEQNISAWPDLFKRLTLMYSRVKSNREFIRVNKGLWYFYKGLEENYLDFKLPHFVRSLEALILPDKGKTTKQFKARVNKWWIKHKDKNRFPDDDGKSLGVIYNARCDFDHLHGLKNEYSDKQLLIGYQAEATARIAYQQVLLNDIELENFSDEGKIKKYWEVNKP